MPESPYHLTVRVVLNPAVPAEAGDAGKYRWDRILVVLGLVAVSLGLLAWLNRSPETAPPEVVAVAPAADAALDAPARAPGPATEVTTPAPGAGAAQSSAEPGSRDPAQVEEPARAESLALSPSRMGEQLPAEPAAATAEKTPVQSPSDKLVEEQPGEQPPDQVSARGSEPAIDTEPAVATIAGSSGGQLPEAEQAASSRAAAGPALRNPPVTPVSTRIVSEDVRRFLITDRVEAREPVGDISDIREDRKVEGLVKVIAYSDVAGRAGEFLEYRWIRGDRLVAKVPVGVGSDSWRSYTSKFLNKDMRGSWRVELRTRGGELLAETAFEY